MLCWMYLQFPGFAKKNPSVDYVGLEVDGPDALPWIHIMCRQHEKALEKGTLSFLFIKKWSGEIQKIKKNAGTQWSPKNEIKKNEKLLLTQFDCPAFFYLPSKGCNLPFFTLKNIHVLVLSIMAFMLMPFNTNY